MTAPSILTVNPTPGAPAIPEITRHESGAVTLITSGAPSKGSYRWYTVASGGSPVVGESGPSYTTPAINSTTTYYVSAVSSQLCEGPRAAVTVTVLDADEDGIPDHNDLDDDNDGIQDAVEGSGDKDGDGIVNSIDLDADGDGIVDAVEANNGLVPSAAYFYLNTGRYISSVGANGLVDVLETHTDSGTTNYILPDKDGDGVVDFLDIDSDNDGIKDNQEAQHLDTRVLASGQDADQDGIDDYFDSSCGCTAQGATITPLDSDLDGTPDYLDSDSDDDGTPDEHEAHDENDNGNSSDDLKLLAEKFLARVSGEATEYYPVADAGSTWLKDSDKNGVTDYLQFGAAYYHDSDADGQIDLFEDSYRHESAINSSFRDESTITPLPVTLISFVAKVQQGGVMLNWATASEQNNYYFIIERSVDGRTFIETGKVKGAGNSNIRLDYALLDSKAPAGTLYYRLKQIDFDGKSEYSKAVVVQLKEAKQGGVAKLYPNPATDISNLDLTMLPAGAYAVRIISAEGRLVQESTAGNEVVRVLEVQSLKSGHYIIQIQSEALVQTLRFVKQ